MKEPYRIARAIARLAQQQRLGAELFHVFGFKELGEFLQFLVAVRLAQALLLACIGSLGLAPFELGQRVFGLAQDHDERCAHHGQAQCAQNGDPAHGTECGVE